MLNYSQERIKRASFHQKEAMIQFMEQHPEIGNEKLASHYDIFYRKDKWIQLTRILNKLPGKPKTPGKWQKAWQDWRYNTRKKVARRSKSHKLTSIEQRLLAISNNDNVVLPDYKTNLTVKSPDAAEEQTKAGIDEESSEKFEIKQEIEDISNEDIGDLLETRLIELPNESFGKDANVSTMTAEYPRKNIKKKYMFYDRNNVREIHRVAKCVEKSFISVKKICHTQEKNSAKLVSLLEENSRTLQSLAESQMRQAEALERQVSLEESRNSILKGIAAALSALKRT